MTGNSNMLLFKEEQRYKGPRISYIITAVVVLLILDITFLARQYLSENASDYPGGGDKSALLVVAFFLVVFTIGFVIVFSRLKMITRVSENDIHIVYPPLMKRGKKITKEEIESFEIRQYKPLVEFGGWGIKTRGRPLRRRRFGKALTAYGKTGLQLHLRNGQKFLIGTQRPEPLRMAMTRMIQDRDIDVKDKNERITGKQKSQ